MKNKLRRTLLIFILGMGPMIGLAANPSLDCTSFYTWEQVQGMNTSVKFQNESSGNFNNWMWDFGDGISSSEFHPEHEFATFGIYVVCLTVSDGINCTDVFCDTVEVIPQCEAEFEFSYVPTTPIYVQFTDLSTGFPNFWHWDFGDGNTSGEQNPVHPYPVPGNYEVCLIIQHDDLQYYCTDTIYHTIEIPDTVACEAIYTYDINPDFPIEVTFMDHSIGNITDWEWDFGDGATSTEQNPVHLFPAPGEYLVCLNVYNADSMASCFHFICETLDLPNTMLCIADFSVMADSSSQVVNQFNFTDQSNGYPDHWVWDFGDGHISHDQHPTHVYEESGLYEVCLNSWNSNFPGCNDIQCKLLQTPDYWKLGGQAFIGLNPINNPNHSGDTGMAILYRQRPDMSLEAVDTNVFYEHGYYWFNDKMELPYLMKISLTEGSENYDQVIPTYYPSSMRWQQAGQLMLNEDLFEMHTSLIEIADMETGIAGINGRIVSDQTRDLNKKRAYEMVPVILTDQVSQPLAWTCTNNNGQFNFEGLPYGSYLVYADIAGLYSLPEAVILDENLPQADSVYITMYMESQLSIREPDQERFSILSLYPNPANDMITLSISADESSSVELMVYNQLGQEMLIQAHMIYKGENKLEINISRLPESIYFLRMQAVNSKPLMKTFIKVD